MKITSKILWGNRSGGGTSWFHPRACALNAPSAVFMTLQSIGGSDYYGPLHECFSADGGVNWSTPVPVSGYEWKSIGSGISEGVCDVVPEYHAPTQTVLAIGHNVYYRDGKLFDTLGDWGENTGPQLQRFPVWGIRDRQGWLTVRQKLEIPGMESCSKYSCGCSQRLFTGKDKLLIPLTFGEFGMRDRKVTTVLFRYDGRSLHFLRRGSILQLPVGRGLLEPSLVRWRDRILLTIRAEDGRAYHAESADGLDWHHFAPWEFDDGTPVITSTTQQHFLTLGGHLFLIYTRDDGRNRHVFRFRAPLYMAEVNPGLQLMKSSEKTVLPLREEAGNAAGMGNFQTAELDDAHAIVTVGEERSFEHYFGDTLCAYIERTEP